eukprot:m.177944 g.177944  ORF g.177944 m.177944 type:complete len:937 (-) comp9977_c0_seq13:71-2881(-)
MLALVVVLALAAHTAAQGSCIKNTTLPDRLPLSVIPSHYDIVLNLPAPDSDSLDFDGETRIDVVVVVPTTCVVLHAAASVSITSTVARSPDGSAITATGTSFDAPNEMATISFPATLSGPYTLTLVYKALVRTNGRGLFKCNNRYEPLAATDALWDSHDGGDYSLAPVADAAAANTSHSRAGMAVRANVTGAVTDDIPQMLATQFERSDARAAFPCFDEPGLKATFEATISAVSPVDQYTILFNTPMTSSSYMGGRVIAKFEKTIMRMSTYLVAVAVGHFDHVEKVAKGTLFRIFTPRGLAAWGEFALNVSTNVVDYFERTYQFSYTRMNPKLDQISVAGRVRNAMENMGLCTYSPGYLICDPATCGLGDYQKIALVVTHEISHQWFGNTITAEWWSTLYLNEGFARYLQYTGVQYLHPEWDIFTTVNEGPVGPVGYYLNTYLRAMRADYLGTAPPVVVPETSPQNNNGQIFYEKGASVNSMVADVIGAPAWDAAFAEFINTYAFQNPSVADMIGSVAAVAPAVAPHFKAWIETAGFPVVLVTLNEATGVLNLTQVPITPTVWPQPSPLWWLPLRVVATLGADTADFVVELTTATALHQLPRGGAWTVRVDPEIKTFSIPYYQGSLQETVWDDLAREQTSPYWRYVTQQSSFFLARTGWLSASAVAHAVTAVGALSGTPADPIEVASQAVISLWDNVIAYLAVLGPVSDATYNAFLATIGAAIERTTLRVGITGGSDKATSALRTAAYNLAVVGQTASATVQLLALFAESPAEVPADVQAPAYQAAGARGSASDIEALTQLYRTTTPGTAQHASVVLGLSMVPTPAQCEATLALVAATAADWSASVQHMLRVNRPCRQTAWAAALANARTSWASGCSATAAILARLQAAGTSAQDLADVTSLLAEAGPASCVSALQKSTTLHAIAINAKAAAASKA